MQSGLTTQGKLNGAMSSKQHNCPKMTEKGKVNDRKGNYNGIKPKKTN